MVSRKEMMKQFTSGNGQDLREMFSAGTTWLEKNVEAVNAINVFPVPDGDCGKNMLLTMRSAMEKAYQASGQSASSVVKAMAQGALLGARGNSGVILSQILRGLAKGLEGKESFTTRDLAEALTEAAATAYRALSQPVEGTMLTVIHDVAVAAKKAAEENPQDLKLMFEAVVSAAEESVARTPSLLPILREAGVVDAGGEGLHILLAGALSYLRGEVEPQQVVPPLPLDRQAIQAGAEAEEPYGYCTQLLIEGQGLNPVRIRKRLEGRGKSLMVVGDESNVRVHIHTDDPSAVLRYGLSLGNLHQISIESMDDQHREFVARRGEKSATLDIAVVAVALGEGMKKVFHSAGVTTVVSGGQTMNPSVQELLTAVESVPSNKVMLLPNNKNVVLTASQVQELTSKKVVVVPTKTMPQGMAALLTFNSKEDLAENTRTMKEAAAAITTVEIAKAVRTTRIKGLAIKKGQFIAIIDDENLVAAGDDMTEVIFQALDKVMTDTTELVTVYYGAGTRLAAAKKIAHEIDRKYPAKQIELVEGGQPNYKFIISLE
jgi:DAK2 domain fusion protein YloV